MCDQACCCSFSRLETANCFDFLRHGVEVTFSAFRSEHFGKVVSFLGLNGTLDEIKAAEEEGKEEEEKEEEDGGEEGWRGRGRRGRGKEDVEEEVEKRGKSKIGRRKWGGGKGMRR